MAIIKVPKTPLSAFNKSRPVSSLLQAQIAHLEAAVAERKTKPAAMRRAARGEALPRPGAVETRRVRTEGAAARYVEELTRALRAAAEATVTQPAEPPPVAADAVATAPPATAAPPARRRASTRKKASARANRKPAARAGQKSAGRSKRG